MEFRYTDYFGNRWDVFEIEPGSCFMASDDCPENVMQFTCGKWRMTGYTFMPLDPKPADERTVVEVARAHAEWWLAYYMADDDEEMCESLAQFIEDLDMIGV